MPFLPGGTHKTEQKEPLKSRLGGFSGTFCILYPNQLVAILFASVAAKKKQG